MLATYSVLPKDSRAPKRATCRQAACINLSASPPVCTRFHSISIDSGGRVEVLLRTYCMARAKQEDSGRTFATNTWLRSSVVSHFYACQIAEDVLLRFKYAASFTVVVIRIAIL